MESYLNFVYYAIVYSTLCMGVIYGVLQREDNIHKIEIIQKKYVRIITFSDFNSHTNPLFIQLKILKLRDVIKLQQLKLVYEFTSKIVPTDLMSFFFLQTRGAYNKSGTEKRPDEYVVGSKYWNSHLW